MKKLIFILIFINLYANEKFPNSYTCGIFPGGLVSYKTIQVNGQHPTLCGSDSVYAKIFNNNHLSCSIDTSDCSNATSCNIKNPPKNKYNPIILNSNKTTDIQKDFNFTKLNYKDYNFHNGATIHFNPQNSYNNRSIKYMTLGSYTFDNNNYNITFEPGDYYFEQLSFNGNNINITLPNGGPVRIFIKHDLNFNKNNLHINEGKNSGNLFIYVGGNLNISGSGGGNGPKIYGFIYVKGDANLNTNSNNFEVHGGITAEGNININGNNAHFYNDSNAEILGYGQCKLCYALNNGGHWINLSNFLKINFNFPRNIGLINNSGEILKDVNVSQIESNPSWFSMSSPEHYAITDENNQIFSTYIKNKITYKTLIGNYSHSKSSNTGEITRWSPSFSIGKFVNTELNTTAKFGNYNSGGFEHYLSIKTYGLSGHFMGNNNLKYYANYTDKNERKYSIQLDYCQIPIKNHSYINGDFGAWDVYRDETDQHISTKTVNKPFNLTLKFLSEIDPSDSFNIDYYLFNANNNKVITSLNNFLISDTHKSTTASFNINKAYQNVKVGFKVCADYALNQFNYKPLSDCIYDCNSNYEENNICFRYFESKDAFAIKPDKFKIISPSFIRADNNISSFSIKALDYLNNATDEYNQTNSNLSISVSDVKSCPVKPFKYDINFYDGIGKINYIKYPEVGKLNVTVVDDKFAKIDADDTDYNDRIIKGNFNITVIPDHFNIKTNNIGNYKGGSFTYLSNDLNMSGEMNATITAVNKNNTPTTNYNSNCYAKKVEINISHSSNTPMENLNKIITQYSQNDKDNNISFNLDENNFTDGVLTLNLKINFDRNISHPTNPFNLNLNNISITDENQTYGFSNINDSINFIYGKILANDKTSILNDTNITIVFEKYNQGWSKNIIHTNEGKVYKTFSKELVHIIINEINKGEQNISVSPSTNTRPYKIRLHLFIPTWLWYSKSGIKYKSPSNNNTDCETHPCLNILFLPQANRNWIGVGTNEKENNVSKHTINININGIKDRSYHKINW